MINQINGEVLQSATIMEKNGVTHVKVDEKGRKGSERPQEAF